MRKSILICLLGTMLLTGCTDIRTRKSPDVLAIDSGNPARTAMYATQDDTVITAVPSHPLLFRTALENAAGAEISAGHLSLLLLNGNPAELLPGLLQSQEIAPTCKVLYVRSDPCGLLESGGAPTAGQLDAAVSTGQLPVRTADLVYADLSGGSGVSALPAWQQDALTLALFDAQGICSVLTETACRGLALLGGTYDTFSFNADSAPCTVRSASLRISANSVRGRLCFTVSGSIRTETSHLPAAELLLTEMVSEALTQTAQDAGADLLFLRETALRCGISDVKTCTQMQWRELLKAASFRVDLRVSV